MNRTFVLAVVALAAIALAGLVAAHPWNIEDMTQEEKDTALQVLEHRKEMIQNQISYINGEITEEQFEDLMDQHRESMEELMENSELKGGSGCPMMGGGGRGMGGMHGMMNGIGF